MKCNNIVLKDFHSFSIRGRDVLVVVRERNSSQASRLERDRKRKSFIYSTNLKNETVNHV